MGPTEITFLIVFATQPFTDDVVPFNCSWWFDDQEGRIFGIQA
jgi:hypothetical protein